MGRQGGAAGHMIFTVFDRAFVIWSLRRLEGSCGSVCCRKEVRPDLLVRSALEACVIHSGAFSFVWMKCWPLPKSVDHWFVGPWIQVRLIVSFGLNRLHSFD
jgi:hypothetical protein